MPLTHFTEVNTEAWGGDAPCSWWPPDGEAGDGSPAFWPLVILVGPCVARCVEGRLRGEGREES